MEIKENKLDRLYAICFCGFKLLNVPENIEIVDLIEIVNSVRSRPHEKICFATYKQNVYVLVSDSLIFHYNMTPDDKINPNAMTINKNWNELVEVFCDKNGIKYENIKFYKILWKLNYDKK